MNARALLVLVVATVGCDKPATPTSDTPAKAEAAADDDTKSAPAAGLPDRDPALARRLVRDEGALLLDVRTEEEFAEGAVQGAVLIPHDQLPGRIQEVLDKQGGDKSKPIVVYCKSGRRADIAKQTLIDNGFEKVTNLGGYTDWCEDC